MISPSDPIHDRGLRFFGKINASIAHEIRNVLAIINENAGLMNDLTLMSEKGMPVDPVRIRTLSDKVLEQVRRADGIIDNMSRFAHSVDDFLKNVDVGECLNFVTVISGRFAAMRGVTLEYDPASDSVEIMSSPFHLQNLFYLCIDYAMEAAGEGKRIGMRVEKGHGGALVRVTGLESLKDSREGGPSFMKEKRLLETLGAVLEPDTREGALILTLPREIETPNHIKEE